MTAEFAVAVHGLVYLNHKGETLSSEALAENICTNPARVRKVMSKLRGAGLVETREGLGGGYRLAMPPEKIDLRAVCLALGERMISSSWRPGSVDMDCLVASGMGGVLDALYGELNALCLEKLKTVTIAQIDHKLFDGSSE